MLRGKLDFYTNDNRLIFMLVLGQTKVPKGQTVSLLAAGEECSADELREAAINIKAVMELLEVLDGVEYGRNGTVSV